MLGKALSGGGAFGEAGIFNTRAVHAAEIPAAGGIGDARSIARMYAACVGEVDGIRLLTPEQVADATTQRTEGPDIVHPRPRPAVRPRVLRHRRACCSSAVRSRSATSAWADRPAGPTPRPSLAFGYVMNKMDLGLAGDLRSYALVNACYDAIG